MNITYNIAIKGVSFLKNIYKKYIVNIDIKCANKFGCIYIYVDF